MIRYGVGELVYDKADARKRPGIILEKYCGRFLIYFDDQTCYWLYYKEFASYEDLVSDKQYQI